MAVQLEVDSLLAPVVAVAVTVARDEMMLPALEAPAVSATSSQLSKVGSQYGASV